jgi:cysteine-rich repeat protein
MMRWLLLPLFLAALRLVGCGSSGGATVAQKTGCTARKTVFCRCPKTGEGGWQTCAEDGSGFDACVPCDGSNQSSSGGTGTQCGNGQQEVGEQCDDGNFSDDDGCLSDCRRATCGDGHVQAGVEECDDANTDDNDGCTSQCKLKTPPSEMCPGGVIDISADPAGTKIVGDFRALRDDHEGSCGGSGRDAVYSFKAPGNGEAVASLTVLGDSKTDTVIHARTQCDDPKTEMACANTGAGGTNELIGPFPVTKGETYFVFVDSQGEALGGFSLRVRFRPDDACEGQGGPCVAAAHGSCATGTIQCSADKSTLICQPAVPGPEICGDSLDGDCDGIVDNGCPCGHDPCTPGVALAPDCTNSKGNRDDCIQEICKKDGFCCGKNWDESCVGKVFSVCGSARCVRGSCTHPICEVGGPLASGCDGQASCVDAICKTDGFCCTKQWDTSCVNKISDICGVKCP